MGGYFYCWMLNEIHFHWLKINWLLLFTTMHPYTLTTSTCRGEVLKHVKQGKKNKNMRNWQDEPGSSSIGWGGGQFWGNITFKLELLTSSFAFFKHTKLHSECEKPKWEKIHLWDVYVSTCLCQCAFILQPLCFKSYLSVYFWPRLIWWFCPGTVISFFWLYFRMYITSFAGLSTIISNALSEPFTPTFLTGMKLTSKPVSDILHNKQHYYPYPQDRAALNISEWDPLKWLVITVDLRVVCLVWTRCDKNSWTQSVNGHESGNEESWQFEQALHNCMKNKNGYKYVLISCYFSCTIGVT